MRRLLCFLLTVLCSATAALAQTRPNIVLIYADDLGYGDVSAYGARALKTPNMDRVAKEGLRFTDAHAPAATCTPSRYALLTGEYAWRKPGTGILAGECRTRHRPAARDPALDAEARRLLDRSRRKVASRSWPEGWPGLERRDCAVTEQRRVRRLVHHGGDRRSVPTVYVENGRVVGLDPSDRISVDYSRKVGAWPTGAEHPELLKMHPSHGHDQTIVNGISRIGYMTGGTAALWIDEDMADVFTRRAVSFIEQHRAAPFFLYFAPHDPHVPRVPNARFVGATTMGPRGDAIAQFDWSVGEVLAALDRLKLADNTIVIVTSDNGPVVDDGYKDDAVAKLGTHRPWGPVPRRQIQQLRSRDARTDDDQVARGEYDAAPRTPSCVTSISSLHCGPHGTGAGRRRPR